MKVQTVTVEIHEKRNHPHGDYSHYDAKVAYTAEIEDGDVDAVTMHLQDKARIHVAAECDRWVADLEQKRKVDEARSDMYWIIGRFRDGNVQKNDPEKFEANLQLLPKNEQAEYRAKLDAAKTECLNGMRQTLERLIEKAGRDNLDRYDQNDFVVALENLPESERETYRQRLVDASEPKIEAPKPDKRKEPEEEMPF